MKYRAEVDGLRAVAVLPVILFHAGLPPFSGGYVGVDVFFVISGYLITTIITREMSQGRFSLVHFYERRARRILPALFLVMACCLPLAWLLLYPSQMEAFGQNVTATALFSSNLLLWLKSGYFATASEMNPLLHTWSLAVEEQYYILFPLLLMLVWRFGTRSLLACLAVLFFLSLGASGWAAAHAPMAGFYLIPFRGWELLLGSFCAFLAPRMTARPGFDDLFGFSGLLLILGAVFAFDAETPFPGVHALVPTAGTAMVILFAREGSLVQRLLSRRMLVGIGLISYSAYLWHQPAFAFYRHHHLGEASTTVLLLLAVCSLLAAWVSWRFVERPFRDRARFSRRFIFGASAVLIAAFSGVGFYAHINNGVMPRDYDMPELRQFRPDNRALQEESWQPLRARSGDPNYNVEGNPFDRHPWFDPSDNRVPVLVVGNSHSKDIYNILSFSEDFKARFQLARFGAQLTDLDDPSHELYASENYRHARVVIIASRYKRDDVAALDEVLGVIQADDKQVLIVNNIFEFEEYGDRTMADVMLLEAYHDPGIELRNVDMVRRVNQAHFDSYRAGEGRRPGLEQINRSLQAVAEAHALPYLDRMDYVCARAEELCHAIDKQYRKHFYDYGHHTLQGARFFAGRVDRIGWIEELEALVPDS
ncbi:acyltransferase family protein [Wenzhouxiangella sediminis]|uniref:Acyltransferase n=1 Tax=Wenzhouxiangella sediminis TaxID=1792836 RepID=A0A3E1K5M2_9GAMM|nr:acyltransferase family protein [Wenzhouxiangella sediminis]RFF29337.1 acyltransferase [Wenzhouxiangella sediminis]